MYRKSPYFDVLLVTAGLDVKSSQRGASNGAGYKITYAFFGKLILENDEKYPEIFYNPHHLIRLGESSSTEASGAPEVPQSCRNFFLCPSYLSRSL